MFRLTNGDAFPPLTITTANGKTLMLPDDFAGSFGVVLLYRGAFCPYCNAQLAGFARAAGILTELGVQVAALSVDDRATAAALVEKLRLPFAVGYGADADAIAKVTGAYVNETPHHLQTTGFILDPKGRVITAVYSSGALGRLVADDVIGFLRYVKSHG
jgi:peroxiredoxin